MTASSAKSAKPARKLLGALIIAIIAGVIWYVEKHSTSATDKRVGKVARGDLLQRVTIAGNIIPNRKTVINPPYDGYVKALYVKLGEHVKKDQPVVSVVQALGSEEAVFPIRAPFDGTVVQIGHLPGEYVKQNEVKDFIVRIDDLSRLFIEVDAPEIDVVKVRIGQEAEVKASAILTRTYRGVVREMSLAARTDSNNWDRNRQVEFPLRIEIIDPDAQIKPGMSTVIDIIAEKKENVLKLGHEFINQEDDKYFAVLKSGERRDIKVGQKNEESFEILEGLKEGDEVQQIDFLSLIEKEK